MMTAEFCSLSQKMERLCFDMRIPEDLIIPDDKITHYLLVPQLRNDKSKFLAQAGFTQESSEALRLSI